MRAVWVTSHAIRGRQWYSPWYSMFFFQKLVSTHLNVRLGSPRDQPIDPDDDLLLGPTRPVNAHRLHLPPDRWRRRHHHRFILHHLHVHCRRTTRRSTTSTQHLPRTSVDTLRRNRSGGWDGSDRSTERPRRGSGRTIEELYLRFRFPRRGRRRRAGPRIMRSSEKIVGNHPSACPLGSRLTSSSPRSGGG
jgi:hypothetical protein